MAFTVLGVRGTTGAFADNTTDAPSFTSTAGSTLVVSLQWFNSTGTPSGADIADNKSNTYQLAAQVNGGPDQVGVAIYYNIGGTRGASHVITGTPVGAAGTSAANIAVVEISAAGTISYDSTTDNTGADGTSPMTISPAASIAGNQFAVYGVVIDTGSTNALNPPTDYVNIFVETDGSANLVSNASYKNPETGSPTVSQTYGGTINVARQALATFIETGAAATSLAFDSRLRRNSLLRR